MENNLQKYQAFLQTVEDGSFTRAGEHLGFTQSAVSRMIRDLEEELDLCLLERGRGGVRLTSDGEALLPYVRDLCRSHQRLLDEASSLNGMQSGLIRIGTFSSVATHWLPEIIRSFQQDYPRIDYELLLGDYTEIEQWVLEGRVDLGFIRLPASSQLDTIFLENDELMAILPEEHPDAELSSVPVEHLTHEPFMLLEKGARAEISEIFDRHHLTPNVHFTTWDDYAVMSMVEKGLGLSILPSLILKRIPYRIVAKPLDPPAYRKIGVALRDRKNLSLAVRTFLDYLKYRPQP